MRVANASHAAFAAVLIGLGLLSLITGDFDPIWQPVPAGMPAREVLVYLCVCISLACGIGLFWQRTAALAAVVLFASLSLWLLLLRVPGVVLSFTVDFWWSACKTAVMVAAAWVLYTNKHHRYATALYGLALIPLGLAHFLYLKQTAVLVPDWLLWPVAWSYFTGGAYIAAGVALIAGVYARLAAVLSALQTGLITLLVWVPIAVIGQPTAFQWNEIVVSVALTAASWVVADSYRRLG